MAIPRCEHGVYSTDGDGKPSEYCSGCSTPTMGIGAFFEAILGYGEELLNAIEDTLCPACFAPLDIADEYNFECSNCGFNDL